MFTNYAFDIVLSDIIAVCVPYPTRRHGEVIVSVVSYLITARVVSHCDIFDDSLILNS